MSELPCDFLRVYESHDDHGEMLYLITTVLHDDSGKPPTEAHFHTHDRREIERCAKGLKAEVQWMVPE